MGLFSGAHHRPTSQLHQPTRGQVAISSLHQASPRKLHRRSVRRHSHWGLSQAGCVLQWLLRCLVRHITRWPLHRDPAQLHQEHQPEWDQQMRRLWDLDRLEDLTEDVRLLAQILDPLDLHSPILLQTPGMANGLESTLSLAQLLTFLPHR